MAPGERGHAFIMTQSPPCRVNLVAAWTFCTGEVACPLLVPCLASPGTACAPFPLDPAPGPTVCTALRPASFSPGASGQPHGRPYSERQSYMRAWEC